MQREVDHNPGPLGTLAVYRIPSFTQILGMVRLMQQVMQVMHKSPFLANKTHRKKTLAWPMTIKHFKSICRLITMHKLLGVGIGVEV